MTDYIFRTGSSGPMRHASGGEGARNTYPWIGHPRDRESQSPVQPRFALSGPAWAQDLASFQALAAAGQFERAMGFVRDRGFSVRTADIPEAARSEFTTWVAHHWPPTQSDCLSGSGWS